MRFLLVIIVLFSLVGCGVDFCIMGIGTCAHEFANVPNVPTFVPTPGGVLTVTGCANVSVTTGTTVICTVSGGSGSYTYIVTPSTCGIFTASGATASLIAQAAGQTCTVTITDVVTPSLTTTTQFTTH